MASAPVCGASAQKSGNGGGCGSPADHRHQPIGRDHARTLGLKLADTGRQYFAFRVEKVEGGLGADPNLVAHAVECGLSSLGLIVGGRGHLVGGLARLPGVDDRLLAGGAGLIEARLRFAYIGLGLADLARHQTTGEQRPTSLHTDAGAIGPVSGQELVTQLEASATTASVGAPSARAPDAGLGGVQGGFGGGDAGIANLSLADGFIQTSGRCRQGDRVS